MRVEARSVEPSSLCVLLSLRPTLCVLLSALRSYLLRFTNAKLTRRPLIVSREGNEKRMAKGIGAVGCSALLVLFFSVFSSRCSLFTSPVEPSNSASSLLCVTHLLEVVGASLIR